MLWSCLEQSGFSQGGSLAVPSDVYESVSEHRHVTTTQLLQNSKGYAMEPPNTQRISPIIKNSGQRTLIQHIMRLSVVLAT